MTKIVQFTEFGGPEVLQLNEIDLRAPNANEVKLAVKAIGLNRAETMLRENQYIVKADLPSGLGYDASAEVIAIGSKVSSLSVGDKVITIPAFSQSKNGVYGIVDPSSPQIDIMPFMVKGLSMLSHAVVYFTGYPDLGLPQNVEAVKEAKEFLLPRLADGRLKPKISETFKLEEVSDAHRALESNKQVGKIVLTVN